MGRRNFFDENIATSSTIGKKKASYSKVAYIGFTILTIFLFSSCSDVYQDLETFRKKEHEKSKVCLKEYMVEQCNPFNSSEKCSQLYACVVEGEKNMS